MLLAISAAPGRASYKILLRSPMRQNVTLGLFQSRACQYLGVVAASKCSRKENNVARLRLRLCCRSLSSLKRYSAPHDYNALDLFSHNIKMSSLRRPPSRKTVQKLYRPIGIRKEHIADSESLFYQRPIHNQNLSHEYTLKADLDDSTVITVTGEEYGDTSAREFRDQSGLPMFECYRTWSMGLA